MDANVCDVNPLDADVLLPPRKLLLAGFKRQNSDVDAAAAVAASHQNHTPPSHPVIHVASSSSSASPLMMAPPSPTPSSPTSVEFQPRLNLLISSHFDNSQNFTPKQIVEVSKSAAAAAVKADETARAAAQEKAMVASRAVAAAREALALVASFPEEGSGTTTSKAKSLEKISRRSTTTLRFCTRSSIKLRTQGMVVLLLVVSLSPCSRWSPVVVIRRWRVVLLQYGNART